MKFARPIWISLNGENVALNSTEQALDVLTERWPAQRGPLHRDAIETCLKVIDGHRSTLDAETAVETAAEESGILVDREV